MGLFAPVLRLNNYRKIHMCKFD